MKGSNRTLIAALVVGLLIVILAGAMILYFNRSASVPKTDNSVSMFEDGDDSGTESETLQTNPNDDGFGTEVSM